MLSYLYKFFVVLVSRFLILIDFFFIKIFKKNRFLPSIHDYIESKQYYPKIIDNNKIVFFCPSERTLIRVQTLFTKEPETLNWMDNFQSNNSEKIIYWDIGANIGLYSIYQLLNLKILK